MTATIAEQLKALVSQRSTARDLNLDGADLRGVALDGLRADGISLIAADLRDTALTHVKWKACTLRDARIEAADLSGAVLRRCDLDGVRADAARFRGTTLENSSARGARFDGACLADASLTDSDFSRSSFHAADLGGVAASGACFRGADLRSAVFRNADLTDADLRGADLTDADLTGATLDGADLRGAIGVGQLADAAGPAAVTNFPDDPRDALPEAFRSLAATLSPIVREVLQGGERQGAIAPEVVAKLTEEVARFESAAPRGAAAAGEAAAVAVDAVTRAVADLGDLDLASLFALLRGGAGDEPPEQVKQLIRNLGSALQLDDNAGAEDVLQQLKRGFPAAPGNRP